MPTTSHDGVTLYYERHGDHGDPLLCIMGLGAPLELWQHQTPTLARYHRVCVYDNRGIGRSDKPPGPYSTAQLADDAIAVLDACRFARAHVLGMSMGGMIAQELALRHPARVGALVLAATFAKPDEDVRAAAAASPFQPGQPLAIEPKQLFQFIMSLVLTPEFITAQRDWLRALRDQVLQHMTVEGFIAQYGAVMGHDTAERLRALEPPTLVMTGTEDRLVPPRGSDELQRLIPNATLLKFDHTGHGFNVEQPELFNRAVLAFLQRHPLP